MRSTTLSRLIGQGFELVRDEAELPGRDQEPALATLPIRQLPRLMHDRAVALEEQDCLLAAVIRCYRRQPTGTWSAVLLEMLAPALVGVRSRFPCVPEGVEAEDVDQQVLTEALEVAASIPLPEPARRVQRRLVLRVRTRTTRWLARIALSRGESLEEVEHRDDASAHLEAAKLDLLALRETGVSLASLLLLYRARVLGETLGQLAFEFGTTPNAICNRQRRALRRLAKRAPDVFRRFADELPTAA